MSDPRRMELKYAICKLYWDILRFCEIGKGSEEVNDFPKHNNDIIQIILI